MLRAVDSEVDKRVGRNCTVRDRSASRSCCYCYYYLGINIHTLLHYVFIRSCQPAGEMVTFSLHSHWPPIRSSKFSLLQIWNFLLPTLCMPAAAAAKLLQLCPTLCDLIDGSPPGSPVPGILQARTLEWVAISFSNASPMHESEKSSEVAQSCPTLSDPMDCSPPGSSIHGFSRQEYWSGVPLPSLLHMPSPFSLIRDSPKMFS